VKLSTKGRYAVTAMVDLAATSKGCTGTPVTLSDIAERQDISLSYLEQLFCKLRKKGLVKSVRGPGGGYCLGRPAAQTRVSDIILAVDEPLRATGCNVGDEHGCHSKRGRCLTHDLWEELSNHIYLFLSSVTLADVVERNFIAGGKKERSVPSGGGPSVAA
jgi:Rrf2 family iron-sulfur cluster assembly transcriptional regulator